MAAALATHLAVPVVAVRFVLVLLVPLGGAGLLLYIFFWVTIPAGDPTDLGGQRPAVLSRLAPRLRQPDRRVPLTDIGLGLVLLVGAGLLVAARQGVDLTFSWAVPALLGLGGTALAWSQLDTLQRDRVLARAGGRTPVSVVRLLGGTVLAGLGVFLLVGKDEPLEDLLRSAVAALAVLAGAALVLAPWWLRLVRELGDERAARARESERADIAAHLHDSVLQTLA
ncbi:MAG TPA: PspC domain-containing protein, partial [Actinotalea sp.]|nr:PspC domain-containing protein [Actinotalea sp.]